MKFTERVLVLMSLIGYYLAVWRRPADYSLIFISIGALAVLYILTMPFLLQEMQLKELTSPGIRKQFHWTSVIAGVLFGLLSAYCVFSLMYYSLQRMDSIALAENCGIFLLLSGIYAGVQFRKNRLLFHRNMLIRVGIFSVLILLSLALHTLHPAK